MSEFTIRFATKRSHANHRVVAIEMTVLGNDLESATMTAETELRIPQHWTLVAGGTSEDVKQNDDL